MIIAHVSDLHITRNPPAGFLTDPVEALTRVVDHITGLDPQPDLVMMTGDLVDDGDPEHYALLRELLAPLRVPLLAVAGNHDDRAWLAENCHDWLPGVDPETGCYTCDDHPIRIIGLDSAITGSPCGGFGAERETWLRSALAEAPDTPTVIAMHHPPFATGIGWMDRSGLDRPDVFAAVLNDNPQVRLVMAGHQHRSIQTAIGTTRVAVTPATVHQIALHLGDQPPAVVDEPPCYQLHAWTGDAFVSHTAVVDDRCRHVELPAAVVDSLPSR